MSLWPAPVRWSGFDVSSAVATALRNHPVPLLEAAIRQLRDRSMSRDIYVWLAWRLHQIKKPTSIYWSALHAQFGGGFKAVKHFKPAFVEALPAATAAYPEGLSVSRKRHHVICFSPADQPNCQLIRAAQGAGCGRLTPHPAGPLGHGRVGAAGPGGSA